MRILSGYILMSRLLHSSARKIPPVVKRLIDRRLRRSRKLPETFDFAHRLDAMARLSSRELCAVKISASSNAWRAPKRRKSDSEQIRFFKSKWTIVIYGPSYKAAFVRFDRLVDRRPSSSSSFVVRSSSFVVVEFNWTSFNAIQFNTIQ